MIYNILKILNDLWPLIFMFSIGAVLFITEKRIDSVERRLRAIESRPPIYVCHDTAISGQDDE